MSLDFPLATQPSRVEEQKIEATRAAGKAVSGILPKLKRWAGYLFSSAVNFFRLDFSNLFDMFVSAYFALKTFDWNATDQALEKQMEANNKRMVTVAAEALGEAIGFRSVRLINSFIGRFLGSKSKAYAGSVKIPVLSAEIGLLLAEEGNEEAKEGVRRFLNSTVSTQISNLFISGILAARRNHFLGFQPVTTQQKNGSIQEKIDTAIEKLPEFWRQPAEEFLEGIEEGIIEAGYVVAFKIDDHIQAMRYASNNNGPRKVVEVEIEEGSDEKLVLKGTQDDVIDTANTTLLGTVPLIKNRDVGEIFAEPIDEVVKPKTQLRKMVITFNEYSNPPFTRKGKKGARACISIPDAKPGLSWARIKAECETFTRGNIYVSVEMTNGRSMSGYFASVNEGEKVLRKLSTLSTEEILPDTFRSSKPAVRGDTLETKQMHPQQVALLFPKRKDGKNLGPKGKAQKYPLWQSSEPADFKPLV